MKLINYCSVTLLLLCVLLANKLKLTESVDVLQDIVMGAMPIASGMAGTLLSGPIVPILTASVGILQLMNNVLQNDGKAEGPLTKTDFMETASQMSQSIKDLNSITLESKKEMMHLIESFAMHESMRMDLDSLNESCYTNLGMILNPKNNGVAKKAVMNAMLDYYSVFRQTLREFITKYIKPKGLVAATGEAKLFFDLILKREQLAAERGDDCYTESIHSKLFKSYMYILKTLTNSYLMVIAAHTAQYQKELRYADLNEATETQRISLSLLQQYKNDMKTLTEKTTWALNKASRDIRNCETFDLLQGETFERIPFSFLMPKLKDWSYDPKAYFSIYTGPKYSCYTREEDVKYNNYEIMEDGCQDGGLRRPASLKVFVNLTNTDWPYEFALNKPTFGANAVLGHSEKETGGLKKREFMQTVTCYSVFCPAFKKNTVAISTKIVTAKPGNVITGVRFQVKNNVIYIEIQEGKFVDDLTVDPKTVHWTERAESSNEVLYLDSKVRKIELGNTELPGNEYLTSIQLNLKNDGIIGVNVGGSSAPNWVASIPKEVSHLYKSHELSLSGSDNPEQFGTYVTNSVSKSPAPQYVSFQPSDLVKDMGTTTIPFFDIRGVVSDPPSPVSGLGIYHHTVKGSGGFIALKLISADLSRFVDYNVIEKIIDNKNVALV